MKKNILVFPCGSEIGLEIYRSLCYSTHYKLFGGSSEEDHGIYVFQNYVGNIPYVYSEDFIDQINKVIDKYDIDYIFPAHDSVVLKLAQACDEGILKCEVITSELETCKITRSKKLTYKFFANKINVPKVYSSADAITETDFPVFLKPEIGQGSKGTTIVNNYESLKYNLNKDNDLLILEYLPGKEYTVDCFTDRNGNLLFCEGRQRMRVQNGISVNSVTIKDDRFKSIAKVINDSLKFNGVWFFQLKEDIHKQMVLMEIAPRVAGTMGLVRCRGVNLPLISLFNAEGHDVNIMENTYSLVIDRALENKYKIELTYSHVYIDLDDLIIVNQQVNPSIMAFIYQCFNKGIKVHLITKHKDVLEDTLKKYRLVNLFDSVIHIPTIDPKHLHIKEKDAIFIDDSFNERQEVYNNCHISVFDSHMLEALME